MVSDETTPNKKSMDERGSNDKTMMQPPRSKEGKRKLTTTGKKNAAPTVGVAADVNRKRRKIRSIDSSSSNRTPKGGVSLQQQHRPRCSKQGCTNQVQQGGLCIRHGAKVKMCTASGCTKLAQQGGLCIKHGASVKLCSWGDCGKLAQRGGVCYSHGAKARKCSSEGCMNNAKRRGLCKRHGAYRDP